jgi:hypothetical protein
MRQQMSRDRSDALAWRELMRATDADVSDSVFRAWQNWSERESWNGRDRANRATDVDADTLSQWEELCNRGLERMREASQGNIMAIEGLS